MRDAGLTAEQAEAHAEAARDFIMTELVTKSDLDVARRVLETATANGELRVESRIDRLDSRIDRLESRIDTLELRLPVRLGGLIAIAVAILAAIIKL